jgi:hypothetical protein
LPASPAACFPCMPAACTLAPLLPHAPPPPAHSAINTARCCPWSAACLPLDPTSCKRTAGRRTGSHAGTRPTTARSRGHVRLILVLTRPPACPASTAPAPTHSPPLLFLLRRPTLAAPVACCCLPPCRPNSGSSPAAGTRASA